MNILRKYTISKKNTHFFHFNTPTIIFTVDDDCIISNDSNNYTLNKNFGLFFPANKLLKIYTEHTTTFFTITLDVEIVNLLYFHNFETILFSKHVKMKKYLLKLVQQLLLPNNTISNFAPLLDQLLTVFSPHAFSAYDTFANPILSDSQISMRAKEYISETYHTEVSIQEISDALAISQNHLIKYFRKETGLTIHQYITQNRLNDALNLLLLTDLTISTITFKSGFPNLKSFTNAFQKIYKYTPQQFRKKLSESKASFIYPEQSDLYDLSQKLAEKNANIHTSILIEDEANKKQFMKTWQEIITIGSSDLLLLSEVREQLKSMQNDIPHKYIRFHDIFSDTLELYNEHPNGEPFFNFQALDSVLDFILSLQLIPFIEIGFMPKKLATNPNQLILDGLFNTSTPKSKKKWSLLVQAFFSHCINRYGINNVQHWKFEFWNEPAATESQSEKEIGFSFVPEAGKFWNGTHKEYLELYVLTYQTAKEIDTRLQIGGPSINLQNIGIHEWLNRTFKYIEKHNCGYDFLTFHIYCLSDLYIMNTHNISAQQDNVSENFTKKSFDAITNLAQKYKLNIPIYITEWNFIFTQMEDTILPDNDSIDKALHTIESFLVPREKITGLGYWTFTDYTKSFRKQESEFADNLGLITKRGIPKPTYHAFSLLSKLGDTELLSANNFIITKTQDDYQFLFYNISITNEDHLFDINIHVIPPGKYERKEYFLNASSGTPKNIWSDMGVPTNLTTEDIQYIKNNSQLRYTKAIVVIEESLSTTLLVQANSAHFIEYKKIF